MISEYMLKDGSRVSVRLKLDTEKLERQLLQKLLRTKRSKATAVGGGVVLEIVKRVPAKGGVENV